jgi:hypothetical protein
MLRFSCSLRHIFPLLLSLTLVSGCASTVGQFSVISTKPVGALRAETPDASHHVQGQACLHNIFIIPLGTLDQREQQAVDDAIDLGRKRGLKGDALINVKVKLTTMDFILYGRNVFL